MKCNLCPRRCNAERTENKNIGGFCKMPSTIKIARAALHFGEEPCISGKNGSGTVFFSGCSLGCVYCQNAVISAQGFGERVSDVRLAEIFQELEEIGAHNINLVTPTHYIDAIISALQIYKPNIPIVYNSSGYETQEAIKLLSDYIDIFLLDFKYISSEKAYRYSNAANYPVIAQKAIKTACDIKGEPTFKNGIMQSGVIIRHLLLPASTNDAIKIFDWVRGNTPNAFLSLMSQYIPLFKAESFKEINRKITKREYDKVLNYIIESGFENCYFQDLSSATKQEIPDFDLKGV